MTSSAKLGVIDRQGRNQEFELSLDHYKAAADQGLSLAQYLNRSIDTDVDAYGTPFDQMMASAGMYLTDDKQTGIKPPSLHSVLNGTTQINMGPIVRPDGSQALTVSGRLLFPAAVLELVQSQLMDDHNSYVGIYNRMVAITSAVDSPRVDQPIINLTGPRDLRAQPIAQMAEPQSMTSITLSEKSVRIPTFSVGLEISDEAAKSSTIDLVSIALQQQAIGEQAYRVDYYLQSMVNGDADLGISALPSNTAASYDSTIAANGVITHKAWLKWLREDWKKLSIGWVICNLDTYLAIEGRSGRPTIYNGDRGTDERLNSIPTAANPGIPDAVQFFIVDSSVLGANTLVGIDPRYAIRKIVYTGASYSAIEQFIMRRSTAFRFDFAEASFRLIDNAWKKMTLTGF